MTQSRTDMHADFASKGPDGLPQILQHPAAMVPHLSADSKIAAIKELVDRLGEQGLIDDGLDFLQAVLERETLQSTVIGDGLVALPHARGRMVRRLGLSLGRATTPIEFPSGDDRHQVRLICLIAIPADAPGLYLRLLGLLARVFADADFRQDLCGAETVEQMQALMTERMDITSTLTSSIPHYQHRS